MARCGWRTWPAIAGLLVLVIAGGAAIWLSRNWPFTQSAITHDLQGRLKGRLAIGRFRETLFPPGAVASDIKVFYPASGKQNIVARDLVIRGNWHGLLTHTISGIRLQGLRITVPPGDSTTSLFATGARSKVRSTGELELNDASFDSQSLQFSVNQLVLNDVARGETVRFHGFLVTDKPHGELKGEGRAGPVKTLSLATIPLSGTFQYANADLTAFSGLRGSLSSTGRFNGTLARIDVSGRTSVPHFQVDGSAHAVGFHATCQATVNTHNADTEFRQVEAQVARTTIHASGTVAGVQGEEGKTAHVQLAVDQGRVENLLNYFSQEKQPSITGAVKLRATAELPPSPGGFLTRLRLTGNFGVSGEQFTNSSKQQSINDLSATAWKKESHEKESKQADDARTAVSNLRGHVVARDGTAFLSNVSFEFSGAFAGMSGTFQLIRKTFDIHGTLRTTGAISQSTSGFKALMLKVATPFLKKKNTTVVPFAITGTSSNPKVGLDLAHKVKY